MKISKTNSTSLAAKFGILSYVARNVGIECPDDLIASLRALQAIGSKDANALLKRAAAFRQPDFNLRHRKEVEKILNSAK